MLHANIVVCVHWFSTPVCSVSNARPPLCAFASHELPAVSVDVLIVYIAVMVRCFGPFRVAKRHVLHGVGACFALPNSLFARWLASALQPFGHQAVRHMAPRCINCLHNACFDLPVMVLYFVNIQHFLKLHVDIMILFVYLQKICCARVY